MGSRGEASHHEMSIPPPQNTQNYNLSCSLPVSSQFEDGSPTHNALALGLHLQTVGLQTLCCKTVLFNYTSAIRVINARLSSAVTRH